MSYDRSLSIFSNTGTINQIEYAYEAAKRGGISVGLVGKDFVLLASEKNLCLNYKILELSKKLIK